MRAYTHDITRRPRLTKEQQLDAFRAFVDAKARLWRELLLAAETVVLAVAADLADVDAYRRARTKSQRALDKARTELAVRLATASNATDIARDLVRRLVLEDLAPIVDEVERRRGHLVRANLRLVFGVAKRFMSLHVTYEDMVADGNLGLFKSVDRFNPAFNVQFSTYAVHWIRHEIARGIDDRGRTIRVPVCARMVRAKIRKHREALAAKGAFVDETDVAEQLGIRVERLRQIQRDTEPVLRMDLSISSQDDYNPRADIVDGAPLADDKMLEREQMDSLKAVLPKLEPKLAYVLQHRYGLFGSAELTLQQIADTMSVSRERVRQHEMRALEELRAMLEQRELGQPVIAGRRARRAAAASTGS